MVYPAVMFIESTIDSIKTVSPTDLTHELKEFRMLGHSRLEALKKDFPVHTTEIERGYLLGLETARTMLTTMPAAVTAGVTL